VIGAWRVDRRSELEMLREPLLFAGRSFRRKMISVEAARWELQSRPPARIDRRAKTTTNQKKPMQMKILLSIIAVSFAVAGFASAEPVNKDCPISGKPVDASKTSTHGGKEVAFCCEKCKAKFDADPAKFAEKIK
jgi:YHS domain-containing protein